jgi:ribose/xylose/arabinose/galactoside ABC-type transport system permease subunit
MSDTATGATAPQADERLAYRGIFQRALIRPEIGAAIGAISIWIFFWSVSVPFGKAGGAASILDVAAAPLGIMAVAVAMLMIGGEFDLSSGAATGALGILTILLVRDVAGELAGAGFSLWVALPVSLLAALGLGWWNGFLVNRTSLPSFIVTLGSFFVLKGAKLGFSKLIVEQIQVGKLNDLAIHAEETGGSDNGYGILQKVFAAEWTRNDHVWEARDWFYNIGFIAGFSIVALAVYELHFRRRETLNSTGLVVFGAGIGLGLVGVWQLHATDSTGGNTVGAILIGAGMTLGFLGWGKWRYEGRSSDANDDGYGGRAVAAPFIGGLVAYLLAIGVAVWFDAQNSENFSDAFSLGSGTMFIIALVTAVAGAGLAVRSDLGTGISAIDLILTEARARLISGFVVAFLVAVAFLNLSTEQGARAIIFMLFAVGAIIGLLMAVHHGRRHSDRLGSLLLLFTASAIALMALFIRAQSLTPKFRAQAFTVLLVMAALMAIWALATMLFDVRRFPDMKADHFGRNLILGGVALVLIGLVARLGWVTQAELDGGITPTKFSVRILWFLGFTGVATWVLGRTQFGSWTFAVGGNKEAARQVGVPAARTKTQLFMLVSAAAWLVGVLLAFRLNTIQASTGDGEEFEYIIAAVVGGTALTGGYGSTLGAGIGALIMAMAVQGIPSARWNSDWRFVFVGAILLLAVIANNFIRTRAEASR